MFIYDPAVDTRGAEAAERPSASPLANLGLAMEIARRHVTLIAATGVGCALLAFGAGKLLAPRYVATTQIYVDPSAMQGSDSQPIAPGQDSNGFVNYVESQVLIATSRSVLERVVKSENLQHDPEFSASASSSLFGAFGGSDASPEEAIAAAGRALGARLEVKRPERTFVLDLSVSSQDPARAAELANATARAYIEEVNAMHSDAARETGAAIADRLEALRARVIEAEKKVEDYKVANSLVGTRDALLVEQQLKDMDDQIVAARTRMSDARARADQVDLVRKNGDDIGAIASQLNLTSLTPLRAQQAEARQKLADATAELGPRHPQVIDAQARLRAADAAVDAELAQFAQSQRIDYARAKALETSLTHQLQDLERQTNSDDQAMIGLRDLERKASAARDVYELFVNRSRDTGEIQQVEPTRTKIISAAAPPKARAFPPNSFALAGIGFLVGLGLGFASAIRRERRIQAMPEAPTVAVAAAPPEAELPSAPSPSEPEQARPAPRANRAATTRAAEREQPRASGGPRRLTVGESTPLRVRTRRQSIGRLDLVDLGFPALPESADAEEFDAILKAVDFTSPRARDLEDASSGLRFVIVVVGANDSGVRTALAINLALTAARGGARVVLVDAAGRNAKLTRAVRSVARKPVLDEGAIYETENGVRLALPKASDAEHGRLRPEAMLRRLLGSRDDAVDLIVCDGPDASEVDAASVYEYANAIVALDGAAATTVRRLADVGFAPSVFVGFEWSDEPFRMSA